MKGLLAVAARRAGRYCRCFAAPSPSSTFVHGTLHRFSGLRCTTLAVSTGTVGR